VIHFYKLKVKEVRKETPDCVSILFDVPAELEEQFRFIHGQYLTLRTHINGEEVRRSYSVCSSPLENELRVAVKKVDNGSFSRYANENLKAGDVLEAMPPIGRFFTTLDPAHTKHYTALAAGSGITPILSIIKTTLLSEPYSRFTLVYGNRNRHSIIFKEEIEGLKNKFMNRLNVLNILSREKMDAPLNFGRIDKEKCDLIFSKAIDPNTVDEFFICGPEDMTMQVKESLEDRGIAKKRIHFELFTSHGLKKTAVESRRAVGPIAAQSKVTIILDGSSFSMDMHFEGESILDAALKKGADLPYACKGGVCCTCRAKLVTGEVDMDLNYGLEPEEVEQGYILTCQSHPRTEEVVVNFDVK
jgi:ring-1,2-phenylacetyl-CoA epoxidase subunit PaaE